MLLLHRGSRQDFNKEAVLKKEKSVRDKKGFEGSSGSICLIAAPVCGGRFPPSAAREAAITHRDCKPV